MTTRVHAKLGCALLLSAALLAGSATFAGGVLQAEDSAFGPGTITFDTASGKRWLDLTASTSISYPQLLVELEPGGLFEGYQLATDAEIAELLTDAGIDVGPGTDDFVPQNYAPIVALTNLIGVLGDDGNCGSGCTFFYTAGFTAEPPPLANYAAVTSLAWFDNSAPLSQSYPQAPIGRVLFGGGGSTGAQPNLGAWLVLPEAGSDAACAAAIGALAWAARRRRLKRAS